jgi:hypothetical protein
MAVRQSNQLENALVTSDSMSYCPTNPESLFALVKAHVKETGEPEKVPAIVSSFPDFERREVQTNLSAQWFSTCVGRFRTWERDS